MAKAHVASSSSSSWSSTAASGPSRIIIVRHGERVDNVDSRWALSAERPHDPPLTDTGRRMAAALGANLRWRLLHAARHDDPDPLAKVVVLTSPLERCVETAHHMCVAMAPLPPDDHTTTRGAGGGLSSSLRILVEPSLTEGATYMAGCLRKGNRMKSLPTPLIRSSRQLHHEVSHLVATCHSGEEEVVAHRPLCDIQVSLSTQPERAGRPSRVDLQDSLGLRERTQIAAQALLSRPEFAGMTVILVGHGCTVTGFLKRLAPDVRDSGHIPFYTGFTDLVRHQGDLLGRGGPASLAHWGFRPTDGVWITPHLAPGSVVMGGTLAPTPASAAAPPPIPSEEAVGSRDDPVLVD